MKFLVRLALSPYLQLASGLILIASAVSEILGLGHTTGLGARHGVLVMGITHLVQAIPHVVHGAHDLCAACGHLHVPGAACAAAGGGA